MTVVIIMHGHHWLLNHLFIILAQTPPYLQIFHQKLRPVLTINYLKSL